jgi:hypothetical protein
MKKIIRHISGRVLSTFRKLAIGTILYRDLAIVRALPNYLSAKRLFFGERIAVEISAPDSSGAEIPPEFQERLGVYAPLRKYCDTFDNAAILGGDFPMVFTAEDKPLWNAIAYFFFDFDRHYTPWKWFVQRRVNAKWIDLEYAIFLQSTWHSNYFHWLVDNLARLQCLDFMESSIAEKVKIVVKDGLSDFQVRSLAALGLTNIEYINDRNYRVEHLLVPSFPLEQQGYDLDQITWLKNKIIQGVDTNDPDLESIYAPKILILRKAATGRAFGNQDKVLAALIPLGFKAFYLEDLRFEQQVKLFKQARTIVAAHGAGLTNIIFADRAVVIEIFADRALPCYFQLTKTLGFKYGFSICNPQNTDRESDYKSQELEVDIPQLISTIDRLSIGSEAIGMSQ